MSKKITDQEFQELQDIRNEAVEIATILGELTYQDISNKLQIEKQTNRIRAIKAKETVFFDALRELYGDVVINIETGELTSQDSK
jgi:hypothetical protein